MDIKGLNTRKGWGDARVEEARGYSGAELTAGNVDAGVRELDRTRTGMKEDGWR
jgi:hypothetical protein